MNKSKYHYCILACCLSIVALTGCFPEDSIIWSSDGTVGLFRTDGALLLIDGTDGTLTPVDGDAQVMPDLSADTHWIAYVKDGDNASVSEGLASFPPFIGAMLRHDARAIGATGAGRCGGA